MTVGISPEWSSVSYVSIDHLSCLVLEAGKGCPCQGRHQGGLQDAANLPG